MRKLGMCCLIALLSACSGHRAPADGPPRHDVNVAKIPNAKPKVEKLSRYGNHDYDVLGKHYHVLATSQDYHAYGTASWYGRKFHGHLTSSREPYDMFAMTAAHRSLPLPTYLRVRNMENGRQVVVKVNDRGPFHSRRIIDLSYAAAKKLGIVGRGTAKVELTAINPKQAHLTPVSHTVTTQSSATWQVGAFRERQYAEALAADIETSLQRSARVTEATARKLFKVQVDKSNNASHQEALFRFLQGKGLGRPIG